MPFEIKYASVFLDCASSYEHHLQHVMYKKAQVTVPDDYETIQAALSACEAGGSVFVHPGTRQRGSQI